MKRSNSSGTMRSLVRYGTDKLWRKILLYHDSVIWQSSPCLRKSVAADIPLPKERRNYSKKASR